MKKVFAKFKGPEFKNPNLWKREFRIATTGFSRSGKTVFLTSLISHLLNHDPQKFYLGDGLAIVNPVLKPPQTDWEPFDYTEYRRRLTGANPSWPDKTKSSTRAVIEFEFSHWRFATARLVLYDLPGERFADCSMYRDTFHEWSNRQIQWFSGLQARTPEVEAFLNLVNRRAGSAPRSDELLISYKTALASLFAGCHKYISPSTFVLDIEGSHVWESQRGLFDDGNMKGVAESRLSGLTGAEFTPLTLTLINRERELVRQFENNYKRYRKEVVENLFRTLAKCDSLAVLVDMAHILQSGEGVCNDADQFLNDVLEALNPGQTIGQLARRPLPTRLLRGSGITRVAFAASQIDRFHDGDHRRVGQLLDRLVQRYFRALKGAKKKTFKVSAICSAVADDKLDQIYPGLRCEIEAGRFPGKPLEVARLPKSPQWDDWPERWDPQALFADKGGFPRLKPQMPSLEIAVPDHLALDDLFRFLIGLGE